MLPVGLRSDIRDAARALARRPMFLVAAVLSIGIGAGLNAGLYSVVHHVLFESPIVGAAPARLVRIQPGLSFPNYRDLRAAGLPLQLAAMQMGTLTWQADDDIRTISAQIVSDNFFETLGTRALVGRAFTSGDAGREDLVVLTFPFWRDHLGRAPNVLGRTLHLNGSPFVVVGVLRQDFAATPLMAGGVYVPIAARVAAALDNRRAAQFDILGRLDEGIDASEATAAIRTAAISLERDYPEINRALARGLVATSTDAFSMLGDGPSGRIALAAATTLYGLAGLVLLVACANVAGLLLVRTCERRDELSIRLALGATHWRIAQPVLVESLIVACLGCLVGLVLWTIAVAALRRWIAAASTVDVTGLSAALPVAYSGLLAVAVTLACGLAPAIRAVRAARAGATRIRIGGGFTRSDRLQRVLVALQIGVSFVLLASAAFFVGNIARLRAVDPGFSIDRLISVVVRVPPSASAREPPAIRAAIETELGVESVSWGSPVGPPFPERLRRVDSNPADDVRTDIRLAGPRFFETFGIQVVRGRDFVESDLRAMDDVPVAVNETFVRRYLRNADPIGQRFVRRANPESGRPRQVLHIMGVARDSIARTIGEPHVPVVYVPQLSRSLAIRLALGVRPPVAALRARISELEPPGSAIAIAPFGEEVTAALTPVRTAAILLLALGAMGLILACAGLYAVVRYAAEQRSFEIGMRMAFGATPGRIARMIVRDGLRITTTGCIVGGAASWAIGRILQSAIAAQAVFTPASLSGVAAVLAVITVGASLGPAYRAGRADPVRALRHE